MKRAALDILRCPRCQEVLELDAAPEAGDVVEGTLSCAACREPYPIRVGVPRFVDAANYASSFGLQWLTHRRTQLDSFTGLPISRDRLFGVSGWPPRLDGETILEAGSGAGRFTEILLTTGATVFSFDYSRAVEANYLNNGADPRLNLFQGNIFAMPLAPGTFDRVMCLGVIQHTPDPARAFHELALRVRSGGHLVVDVYTKRLISLLQWKYALRPITRRVAPARLYRLVERVVPPLLPVTGALRRLGGRAAVRLSPIAEYSHLGLAKEVARDWAILDTFDMYAPAYDSPQSVDTVRGWFEREGFTDIYAGYGPNGVIGRGRRPA